MDWLHLIVLALATWRISSLFVNEDGPWFIFVIFREWSGIYFTYPYHVPPSSPHDFGKEKVVPLRLLPQILSCIWCTSVYVGGILIIAYYFFPALTFYASLPFALSALAILFNLVVEKLTS